MDTSPTSYIGILNFLSFGLSIIAAVLAIDMYGLLRVGQSGRTWRILIVASVLFVLMQVLGLVEVLLAMQVADELRQVVTLVFAIAFAYAFYRERANYNCKKTRKNRQQPEGHDGPVDNSN